MELEQEIAESKAEIARYRKIAKQDNQSTPWNGDSSRRDLKAIARQYDDTDPDDLQAHIDDLEDMLDDYDILSDVYSNIENEIDRLQSRLDIMESRSHGTSYIDLIHQNPDYYLNGMDADNDSYDDFDRDYDCDLADDSDW